jgi:hypothetical protein
LTAGVCHEILGANRRIEWNGHGADQEGADEGLKERAFGAQHQRHAVAFGDAEVSQAVAQGSCGRRQLAIGDRRLGALVIPQVNMNTVGRALGVPAEGLHQRSDAGGNRRRRGRRWPRHFAYRRRGGFRDAGRGVQDRRDQILGRGRFSHHGVSEANTEGLFEAEQQLHPLEAADTQVAIEGVLKHRPAR